MRRAHMGIRPAMRRADLLFAFLHRNQNAAFIICRGHIAAGIPFDVHAHRRSPFGVVRQPVGIDFAVQALERIRNRSNGGEIRPRCRRDCPRLHSVRNGRVRRAKIADPVFKIVAAIIEAHAAGDDCSSRGLRPLELSLVLQGWGNFYCYPILMCGWRNLLFPFHPFFNPFGDGFGGFARFGHAVERAHGASVRRNRRKIAEQLHQRVL